MTRPPHALRRYLPPEPARIGWGDVVGLAAIVALAIAAFVVLPVVGAPVP